MFRPSVTPFRAADWLIALPVSVEGDTIGLHVSHEFMARYHERGGPAWTLRVGGEIAACYGVLIPWDGLGDVWALVTPVGREHPLMVHRAILRALSCAGPLRLRRLQADVREDFEVGHRWVRALGFQRESRMPAYGPHGEAFYRYVKFTGIA